MKNIINETINGVLLHLGHHEALWTRFPSTGDEFLWRLNELHAGGVIVRANDISRNTIKMVTMGLGVRVTINTAESGQNPERHLCIERLAIIESYEVELNNDARYSFSILSLRFLHGNIHCRNWDRLIINVAIRLRGEEKK